MRLTNPAQTGTNFKLVFCLLGFALLVSCSRSAAENTKQSGAGKQSGDGNITAVTVDKSVAREVPAVIKATGSLVADETSDVASKAAGKVVNVYANVGEFVTKGSVIAALDDKDARLRIAEANAAVKQSQSAVRQAEVRIGLAPNGSFNASTIPEVRAANSLYEQAQTELRQAEANEKRYRELVETGDVPMMTYEQYRTTRDTARARVNAAREQLAAAANAAKLNNQTIKSAQAAVEAAQTQLATAQQAIADLVIRAPFSGYISSRQTAVGEFVTSSTPVATILRTNPIKVQIQVTEADIPYIAIGRAVSVEVDAYKDRSFGGVVTAVNPAIDPLSRAATVEAQIENGNNALRTGMFATVKIVREGGNTGVFVPRSAVYNDQATQSYRVFVIENNVAKLRVVQLGTEENEYIQIISGVNPDETVATSGLDQLYEGAKVSF